VRIVLYLNKGDDGEYEIRRDGFVENIDKIYHDPNILTIRMKSEDTNQKVKLLCV
jgi:hypothetical protein